MVRTAGHAPAGVAGEDLLVIMPSGVCSDELSSQNVILCDLEGNVVDGSHATSSRTTAHGTGGCGPRPFRADDVRPYGGRRPPPPPR
ncbi:class II aldolase/adducin family protein [Streptomyces sp. NPDC055796]